MADAGDVPDPELLHATLDDLQAIYEAEAASDPVGREFWGLAHRLEHGDAPTPDED